VLTRRKYGDYEARRASKRHVFGGLSTHARDERTQSFTWLREHGLV
jgi:hypothetical protein